MSASTASHSDAMPNMVSTKKTVFTPSAIANVLPEHMRSVLRYSNRFGNLARVIVHERDIGRFDGRIRSRCSHRDPNTGLCESRRVVDAISNHGNRSVRGEFRNDPKFVVGKQFAACVVDANLTGNRSCSSLIVTGKHHRSHPERPQISDRLYRLRTNRVGNREYRQRPLSASSTRLLFSHRFRNLEGAIPVLRCRHPILRPDDDCQGGTERHQHHPSLHDPGALQTNPQHRVCPRVLKQSHARPDAPREVFIDAAILSASSMRISFAMATRSVKARLAECKRASFVKGNCFQPTCLFQMDSAFNQNSASSSAAETRHHRDRRRNHQSTGAGEDQKNKRFVQPRLPVTGSDERWNYGHRYRSNKN